MPQKPSHGPHCARLRARSTAPKNDEVTKNGAFKPVEALRGGVRPSKKMPNLNFGTKLSCQEILGARGYRGGPWRRIFGGGKSVMSKEKSCGLTFNLEDCDLGAAQTSSRSKLLLLNPSPKATHRPLVSTILLSGARAVIEEKMVR